jgi:hypothetical protein
MIDQVDLVGGYYDAGDHVKFGLPMAFTVTMLSWSLIEYGDDVAASGELGHALEAIKWGTDYFIKAHTSPDELWAEVIPSFHLLSRPDPFVLPAASCDLERQLFSFSRNNSIGGKLCIALLQIYEFFHSFKN